MKVRIDRKILMPNGATAKQEAGEELTVKGVCISSLMHYPATQKESNGEEAYKLYQLIEKLNKDEPLVDLASEDIVQIKKVVGSVTRNSFILGQVWDALEKGE